MPIRFPSHPGAGPPPKEAVEWLKKRGIKPAATWQEAWGEEHRFAFYVAHMMEKDLLKDIWDGLEDALQSGATFRQWATDEQVKETFDKSGWTDYGGTAEETPYRLRTIYDTNMRTARSAGALERQQSVKDLFPYAIANLGPSKVHREEHEEWEGLCVRVDGAFFQAHVFPCGFGCKCWWEYVSQDRAQEVGISEPAFGYDEWEDDDGHKALAPEGVMPGFGRNPLEYREQVLRQLEQEPAGVNMEEVE